MLLCRRWDAPEKEVEWIVYIPANRRDLQLEIVHKFHHMFLHPGIGRTVWGIVGLDVWGPIRLSSNDENDEKVWVLTCSDYISHFLVTKVLTGCSADDIVTGVAEIIAENGLFRVCLTDQAQYFVSKRFREYLAGRSVIHCVTTLSN
ncbi:hypothetical protein FOZ63_021359 [Perkinsus olseni]|uniref:Integrase catalytic domain-containing protein n=2 Tax=Perkinsus olseni TaxID=32597 RepID=A0A7J6URD5_PEROL|nr:hypothetical protein FOZ63_021359 [Perkinsus olseni]